MQKHISLIIIIIGFCLIIGGIGSYYYEQYANKDKIESCTALTTGRVENCEQQTVRHSRRHGAGGGLNIFIRSHTHIPWKAQSTKKGND